MKFEQLEKVLASATVNPAFREKLMKGEVDAEKEFGLSDEENKVLETLLAGEGAPGLQVLLSAAVVTPSTAMVTPTLSTLTPTMATATPTLSTLTPTMATATPTLSTLTPTMATATPATQADIQRVTELVQRKLAILEGLEAKLSKVKLNK